MTPHWLWDDRVKAIQAARLEPIIAAEDLVPTLAAQAYRDLLPRLTTNEHQWNRRKIGHRFVEMIEGFLDEIFVHPFNHQDVVLGIEVFRHGLRIIEFAESLITISDGKSTQRTADILSHHRHERAGVQSTGQEDTEWNIAEEVGLHAVGKHLADFFSGLVNRETFSVAGSKRQVPIGRY